MTSEHAWFAQGPDTLPLIAITGFMGTGKTETAAALAEILGIDCADMDQLIEARTGLSIPEIFAQQGEDRFRAIEKEVCQEIAQRRGLVVATGGGTVLDDQNRDLLQKNAFLVLLEATMEAILERVGPDRSRPLLHGDAASGAEPKADLKDRVRRLLQKRGPVYEKIGFRVDTTGITPRQAAGRIAASLDMPCRTVTVRVSDKNRLAGEKAYPIDIGRGRLSSLGQRLVEIGPFSKALVVIPENVRIHHLDQAAASLDADGIEWHEIPIRDGDAEKNLAQTSELLDGFAEQGASRDAVVVAMGGGVTGDLGGFAASIYMRGIPLVQVPTTLLAQVDASIGGKVGVNHPCAKNLVGNFHQPHLVLIDACVLRTLPDLEIANGMAEVVKTAVIGSEDLFAFIEQELTHGPVPANAPEQKLRDIAFLEHCVAECAAIKAGIVEHDPFEKDERRFLNLGHTLGHALEAVGSYEGLTHGQAVSIGLVAAFRIAAGRGLIDDRLVGRIQDILTRCGLPVAPSKYDEAALLQALHLDKKKRKGRIHFILPLRIGAVTIVDDVTEEDMLDALR